MGILLTQSYETILRDGISMRIFSLLENSVSDVNMLVKRYTGVCTTILLTHSIHTHYTYSGGM